MTSGWRFTAHGGLMAIIVWAVLVVAFLMRDTYRIDHANYFAAHCSASCPICRKEQQTKTSAST
jgi:hypothetical protein